MQLGVIPYKHCIPLLNMEVGILHIQHLTNAVPSLVTSLCVAPGKKVGYAVPTFYPILFPVPIFNSTVSFACGNIDL